MAKLCPSNYRPKKSCDALSQGRATKVRRSPMTALIHGGRIPASSWRQFRKLAMALAEPNTGHRDQTIEAVNRDVEFALRFRLELIKHLLALATAVLAFTATFRPTLASPVAPWLMGIGWLALAASVAGGLVHMRGWDRFYMTYRDYD